VLAELFVSLLEAKVWFSVVLLVLLDSVEALSVEFEDADVLLLVLVPLASVVFCVSVVFPKVSLLEVVSFPEVAFVEVSLVAVAFEAPAVSFELFSVPLVVVLDGTVSLLLTVLFGSVVFTVELASVVFELLLLFVVSLTVEFEVFAVSFEGRDVFEVELFRVSLATVAFVLLA
jgi:hypothetical protein